jgi:PhnB protein
VLAAYNLAIEVQTMSVQIAPMLAVTHGDAAISFYMSAFDARVLWRLGHGADIVAGLSIGGAEFFLAYEAPKYGTRSPSSVGFTTVRIELFVDDPISVHRRALSAGAVEHSPVSEDHFKMEGPYPIRRILQGAVVDPFGHMWLIGKIIE